MDAIRTTRLAATTVIDMRTLLLLGLLLISQNALSWEGYDYETGVFVEIQKGSTVRSGRDIDVYDYGKGKYIDAEVQSVRRVGDSVTVEVIDNETGEERTFEMDSD